MNNKKKNLEKEITKIEEKIKEGEKNLGDLILKAVTPECTSHIYRRNLAGVGMCIFCGRILYEVW